MGDIGYGYGSECHLLRWMGRHRALFDARVAEAIGRAGTPMHWLDAKFRAGALWPDVELKGLEFLKDDAVWGQRWKESFEGEWKAFWPTGAGIHNWDAVGWCGGNERELVLVEAKAHVRELDTKCGAKHPKSTEKIQGALKRTREAFGVPDADWMSRYYQYANRLAALHFLRTQGISARLLFIYFVGDSVRGGCECPQDRAGWEEPLRQQYEALRLPEAGLEQHGVHKLFLHVCQPICP